MADISALNNLNPAEPLDFDIYKDAQDTPPLPKAGRYTVRAPESFPTEAFGATKAGFLSAQIDPTIVGPQHEGYTLRFTKISAKPFKRGGVTVSQVGDYLRATGRRERVGGSPQEIADAIEQTANLSYEVDVDWRVYEKGTGYVLEGMSNFPSDGNGGHLSTIPSPTVKDPVTGEPQMLRANLFVKRFIAASQG